MNLREFFYLQKSDRKVVIFLLTLAAAAISIVYLLGDKNTRTIGDSENETSILGLDNPTKYGKPKENGYYELRDGKRVELFPFDPNTADSTQLGRLGLAPYQIRNIYKYRQKEEFTDRHKISPASMDSHANNTETWSRIL